MGKWIILFLSIGIFTLPGCTYSQGTVGNCQDKKFRDSLLAFIIDSTAKKERIFYNHKRWQQLCDSVIGICPNTAEAYQLKALPFTKYAAYEHCFSLLDKAVQYDSSAFLPYRAFIKCIFSKDYEGAIIDFEKSELLHKSSGLMDHSYQFFMALCNLELKNYAAAENHFNNDVKIQQASFPGEPPHYNTLLYMGILKYEEKQYESAKSLLLKCLEKYSQHPEANYYLAIVEEKLGNTKAKHEYLQTGKDAYLQGMRLNEDNIFYTNYPKQVTLRDFDRALQKK